MGEPVFNVSKLLGAFSGWFRPVVAVLSPLESPAALRQVSISQKVATCRLDLGKQIGVGVPSKIDQQVHLEKNTFYLESY